SAQHAGGGWRYAAKQAGDTSVVGWQVMALKSGQMSGLNVPEETMKKAGKFLDSVQAKFKYDGKDKEGNAESRDGVGYGYTGPQQTPTMTAVGLLCRQYLGWSPRKVELVNGVNWMRDTYPPGTVGSMYYYYYATQVMHHMQGESWATWNPKMRDLLVAKQDKG